MQSFFTKKYFKTPLACLLIVSLLLQFVPSLKPAKALDAKDILKKIFAIIQVPSEFELTYDGSIKFGSWLDKSQWGGSGDLSIFNCLFKQQESSGSGIDLKFCGCQIGDGLNLKCGWRDNNDCSADCPNAPGCGGENQPCCVRTGEKEKCVNPFSTFRFGRHESQTDLVIQEGPEKGRLTIPNPKTPLRCQLKIPLPDEDDTSTVEEKLAERRACNSFRQVQQAAAQVAYTAKKIFNNTDPLSKCFFLRNCKTSCSFRFGSVTYIITLLDVVRLFVGDATVALNAVQKIINIVMIFQSLIKLGDALKQLYEEGVTVVGSLLDTVKNLATLGSSLRELGVKISDAFVFTPVSIGTGYTEERAKKAYNGFIDLINNFASNLEKYQSAKSEALALVEQTKEDVAKVMEESAFVTLNPSSPDEIKVDIAGFKNEPEIGFLFVKRKDPDNPRNYEKKVKLDKILANYQTMFQPISSLIDQIASLGDMFDGKSFADLEAGTEDEWWEKSVEKYKEFCCGKDYENSCSPEAFGYDRDICQKPTPYWDYVKPETAQAKKDLIDLMDTSMTDDIRVDFSTNRNKYIYMNGRLLTGTTGAYSISNISRELDLATQKIVLDEKFFEDFCTAKNCWRQENDVTFCDDVNDCWQESGEFCRVYTFKGDRVAAYSAGYTVEKSGELLDADYIKGMLYRALSKGGGGEDPLLTLDYNDGPWRVYWESLARLCQDDRWVDDITKDFKMKERHNKMLEACTLQYRSNDPRQDWPQLHIIKNLDGQEFKLPVYDQVWNSETGEYETMVVDWAVNGDKIDQKIKEYKAYTPKFDLGTVSATSPWFETFQKISKGIDNFRAAFRYLDPDYIRTEVIGSALGAYDCDANTNDNCARFAYKVLDESKDSWRWYWERLGRALLEKGRVDYILEHKEDRDGTGVKNMKEKHERIMELVVAAMTNEGIVLLAPIKGLNNGKFEKDEGFSGDKIQNPLNEYKTLFDDPGSFSMRYDKIARIETIKHNIDILEQQDGPQLWTYVPPNKYWQSQIWCTKDPEDIDAVEHYINTFGGDVVDYDWEERIGLLVDAKDNLDTVKDALSYKLGPSQPVLVYYIIRAQDKLIELAQDFGETMETLLGGIQKEINSFCGDIEKDPVYKTYRALRDCYDYYQNGAKSCPGGPVPSCVSWIGSCGDCEQCIDNCRDKCNVDCTVDYGDNYYECECYDEDDGWEWESDYNYLSDCEDEDGCKQDCGSADWDCDKVTEPDEYDCPLPGGGQNYSDQSTCKANCKRANCSSDADCEDHYCGNPDNPNGACWWQDYYKTEYQEELNKLNAECARRKRYFDYLQQGSTLHIDFAPIIQSFQDNFKSLQTALTNLQGVWKDPVVVDRESAVASSTVQKILYTINESKKIIEEIVPQLEAAFADLGLEQARKYLNAGYCNDSDACTEALANAYRCPIGVAHNNCEEVSTATWNKFLLNDPANPEHSGIIVRIEKEIETAKRQVLNFIKMKAGTYDSARHPQLEQDNITFPAGCPDENAGALFLNRIRCFEDENNRDFYQLPDFIKVVEGLEDVSFAMDDLKENIVDLEPSIDMEVVDGLKGKLETIGENPITLLDGTFQAIRDIFSAISVPPLETDIGAFLNNAWSKLGDWNVFGRTASTDKNRRLAYRNAMENLEQENITDLIRLVFAEDDVNKGCNALSLVLNSNPRETRESCLARSEDLIGTAIDDFNNAKSQQGCRALGELDLTLFTEDSAQKREELIAEKQALEDRRKQIKRVTCNDTARNSYIACPEWFCEGVYDPECWECPAGIETPNEMDCRRPSNYSQGALWEAGALPVQPSDSVKPTVCQSARLPVACKLQDLQAKCGDFKRVDITAFDSFSQQAIDTQGKIDQLKDERACIATENCSWGFADKLFGFALKTANISNTTKPCVSCPNWICAGSTGNQLPPTMATNDPYCQTVAQSSPPGLKLENGIVWDSSWPSGLRKWPRTTACFQNDAKTLENVLADKYSTKNLLTMTRDCIAKQKELDTLLEQSGGVTVVFPWDTENWPCKTKQDCLDLKSACGALESGSATPLASSWNEWPPRDPCGVKQFAEGYQSAKIECINTQKRMQELRFSLGENSDFDWVTKELIAKCDTLAIQKSLKKECEHFKMLEDNVFPDSCGGLSNCSSEATDGFQAGRVVSPCKQYCDFINERAWNSFCKSPQQGIEPVLPCGNSLHLWRHNIPNLTLPTPGNKPEEKLTEDELKDLNELKANRAAAIERCGLAAHNIQQPLDEVMKIFAILIGIKSATGLYSGVQILKSSTTKIINDVKDFIKIIKGTPCEDGSDCDCDGCEDGGACSGGIVKDIQCIWKQIDEGLGGADQGLKVKALECESHPAVSYSTTKQEKLTSNQGGPVCPGIDEFFQQIEGQFGVVRQNVRQIDLTRRGVKEGGFSIGRLNLHLWDEYPVIYHSFDDLHAVAEDIRTRTSYVWALANAVEFANKQCACGQSYCKMPLCISGLPLAFAPVKNPYCYIVWLFRYPMLKVVEGSEGLEKLLEQQVK